MHTLRSITLTLALCSVTATTHAAAKLTDGAGTLPRGTWAFTFNGGVSYPTLGYTVGADVGVTDHLQLGVKGSYGILWAMGGISTAVNFLTSADESHFFGFRMTPSYLWFNAIFSEMKTFIVDPTLVYEYRFGDDHDTGVFVKAGTQHLYADIGSDALGGFFKSTDINTKKWGHAGRTLVGLQHQFGERFAMLAEGGAGLGFATKTVVPQGQLGLSWAF